jgi:hypothetical protein
MSARADYSKSCYPNLYCWGNFLLLGVFSLSQAASLISPAIVEVSKISTDLKNTKDSVDKLTAAVLQLQTQLANIPK